MRASLCVCKEATFGVSWRTFLDSQSIPPLISTLERQWLRLIFQHGLTRFGSRSNRTRTSERLDRLLLRPKRAWPRPRTHTFPMLQRSPGTATRVECRFSSIISEHLDFHSATISSTAGDAKQKFGRRGAKCNLRKWLLTSCSLRLKFRCMQFTTESTNSGRWLMLPDKL